MRHPRAQLPERPCGAPRTRRRTPPARDRAPIDLPKSCASIPSCASMHGSDRRIRQPMEIILPARSAVGRSNLCYPPEVSESPEGRRAREHHLQLREKPGLRGERGEHRHARVQFHHALVRDGCACVQVAMAIIGGSSTEAPDCCLFERIRDSWPKFIITRNATIQHRSGIAHKNVTGPIVGGRSGWRRRAFKRNRPLGSCSYPLLSIRPEGLGRGELLDGARKMRSWVRGSATAKTLWLFTPR